MFTKPSEPSYKEVLINKAPLQTYNSFADGAGLVDIANVTIRKKPKNKSSNRKKDMGVVEGGLATYPIMVSSNPVSVPSPSGQLRALNPDMRVP